MASGVPISSLAMFGFLATVIREQGWSWAYAALVVGFFTAAGHAGSYAFFRAAGAPIWDRIARRYPGLSRAAARLEALCNSRGRADLGLFAARWIGSGYSQLFWLLGALRRECSATLRMLFLADVLWAGAWTWAVTRLTADITEIAKHLSRVGWVLLLVFVPFSVLKHISRRR
ncbi:MAG: hypothetical protein AB1774_06905 [Bacillota bacterium]